MRRLLPLLLLTATFAAAPARADDPLTPEEALKRLQEREAARKKAAATQPAATPPATKPANAKPSTRPAPDPSAPTVPLANGKFQFIPPPSETWESVKQASDRLAVFMTKNHDGIIAIQVLPPDIVVDERAAQVIVQQKRLARQKAKEKMLLEPVVEHDDRFALRIHERYEVAAKGGGEPTGKIADHLYLYRGVGGAMLMATLNTVADDAEAVKAAQDAVEDALVSATAPGKTKGRKP